MKKEFWDKKWEENQTGWDLGSVSPPIAAYIDQLNDTSIRILIPGCGNAYEAEYCFKKGFKNTFVIDISEHAIHAFQTRFPDFPKEQVFKGDFFDLDAQFDVVLEQTFFCAINPLDRWKYAEKMAEIIPSGGKLVGLLFDFPLDEGPPFGGCKEEYLTYFEPNFIIHSMLPAYNSIQPRMGRELFICFERK